MDAFSFPHDDYALTILHEAAMQSTHSSESTTNHSSLEHPDTSLDLPRSEGLRAGGLSTTSTSTSTNVTSSQSQSQSPHIGILNSYDPPSSRSMETLSFNPARLRQHPYQSTGYHVGAQMSHNFASNLGILNAESCNHPFQFLLLVCALLELSAHI